MPIRRAHSLRRLTALLISAVLYSGFISSAHADRLEDLTRALADSSYKVRVQAALVLGKLGDRRATAALIRALQDENESVRGVAATAIGKLGDKSASNALLSATNDSSEFVRTQAKKALELIAGRESGGDDIAAAPRAGAKFYLTIGFGGSSANRYQQIFREALARELQKLPSVTLSVGKGDPTPQVLQSHRLQAFVVDGTIQRLSALGSQVDCDLKAFIATYPGKAIKMMTTEGASLQAGSDPSGEGAKRECLAATAEAVREDVGKYLRTLE
jgi:hypothetical protein